MKALMILVLFYLKLSTFCFGQFDSTFVRGMAVDRDTKEPILYSTFVLLAETEEGLICLDTFKTTDKPFYSFYLDHTYPTYRVLGYSPDYYAAEIFIDNFELGICLEKNIELKIEPMLVYPIYDQTSHNKSSSIIQGQIIDKGTKLAICFAAVKLYAKSGDEFIEIDEFLTGQNAMYQFNLDTVFEEYRIKAAAHGYDVNEISVNDIVAGDSLNQNISLELIPIIISDHHYSQYDRPELLWLKSCLVADSLPTSFLLKPFMKTFEVIRYTHL